MNEKGSNAEYMPFIFILRLNWFDNVTFHGTIEKCINLYMTNLACKSAGPDFILIYGVFFLATQIYKTFKFKNAISKIAFLNFIVFYVIPI